jgi:hypothetical protein
MELTRILHADDKLLKQLLPLYIEAFPPLERRSLDQLVWMIENQPEMYFNAVEIDHKLSGFFIYWDMGEFYFLEHLAVYAHLRNKKAGLQIIHYMAAHLDGLRLLETEPATDEVSIRRVKYYERNGYKIVDKNYVQPSYDRDEETHHLWIMGNRDSEHLPEFIEKIKTDVYRNNYNWEDK